MARSAACASKILVVVLGGCYSGGGGQRAWLGAVVDNRHSRFYKGALEIGCWLEIGAAWAVTIFAVSGAVYLISGYMTWPTKFLWFCIGG